MAEEKESVRDSRTEVYTLNVTLQDQDLNQYVVKFSNPKDASEITRAGVVAAFNRVIGGSGSLTGRPVLYSRANAPYTAVGNIEVVTVVTMREEVS